MAPVKVAGTFEIWPDVVPAMSSTVPLTLMASILVTAAVNVTEATTAPVLDVNTDVPVA
jgi:hypothetical protein